MAGKPTKEQEAERAACTLAIIQHLEVHGNANWAAVRQQFPKVEKRKFFRWVKAVRDGEVDVSLYANAGKVAKKLQRTLPVAPPAHYMADNGTKAIEKVNLLVETNVLFRDVAQMRIYAAEKDRVTKQVVLDANGDPKLGNFVFWEKAVMARLKVIETALALQQQIWDLQKNQDFYDEIVRIIVEEMGVDPEMQLRVMRRLEHLDRARGMNSAGI